MLTQSISSPQQARTARAVFGAAIILGIAADVLFHDMGPGGVSLPLWLALLTLCVLAISARADQSPGGESIAWLGSAIVFGAGLAWRDSGALQALDFLAALFSIALAGLSLNDRRTALLAARARGTIWGAIKLGISIAAGILPVALRASASSGPRDQAPARRTAIRAIAITVPVLFLFGALLVSADPVFASLATLPSIDFGTLAAHVVLFGFFAWIVGGWARYAFLSPAPVPPPETVGFTLGALDVTTIFGALDVLFTAFILAQLGRLFGGEPFIRAHSGLTLSAYARSGFFQLAWIALLTVPLLLTTRALLQRDSVAARRHTAFSIATVVLVGAILLSAASRLRLYVDFYDWTEGRFYIAVFLAWLAFVLIWLLVTLLRGWSRIFVAGVALSALVTVAGLNIANPDALIVRMNLARASARQGATSAIDLSYLATLSGDAVPLTTPAVLAAPAARGAAAGADSVAADRCHAAKLLLKTWGPASRTASRREDPSSWPSANAGESAALRSVAGSSDALRKIASGCPEPHR